MKARCLLLLAAIFVAPIAYAVALRPTVVKWIDRPWEYRYLLYANEASSWANSKRFFEEELVKNPQKVGEFGEPIAMHYEPTLTLNFAEERPRNFLNVLRLDINRDRTIVQPTLKGDQLRPRLNWLEDIVLTPSDDKPEYVVKFGFFFMGSVSAPDGRYSPTICSRILGDSSPPDESGRYWKGFMPVPHGYFGCREWAAQLYDRDRPYIDVTSYEMIPDDDAPVKKGKKPRLIPMTYIRPFVGFSRFDSPAKPVIGNHKGQWYCITDCPAGDAPGPIADMSAWAQRSGWALPKKPKNVREFMDKPVKPGAFQE